jgi:hypothetical protein
MCGWHAYLDPDLHIVTRVLTLQSFHKLAFLQDGACVRTIIELDVCSVVFLPFIPWQWRSVFIKHLQQN